VRAAAEAVTDRCLFSAPYAFLPEALRREYETVIPTAFREIWARADATPDPGLTAWVLNPGQRFVVDADVLDRYPALRVLVTPSTGSNHVDVRACQRRGVPLLSLLDDREGLEAIAASAEFTFLLLLNTLRRLDVAAREVSARRWRHREDMLRGHELSGKLVGLIGLGRIGRRLARYCAAFDARVAFHDPHVHDPTLPARPLEALFDECDVVCVCCALTPDTHGLITERLLARLRPGACLINTSRGEIVDEKALLTVLAARPDIRVGLDVLPGEVADTHLASPLLAWHDAGRIVVTPHISGATLESQTRAARIALGLLRRHVATCRS
jgi:D-3-phosphoglycerate dehydrogenase / 2-oxoglutarate reductase